MEIGDEECLPRAPKEGAGGEWLKIMAGETQHGGLGDGGEGSGVHIGVGLSLPKVALGLRFPLARE